MLTQREDSFPHYSSALARAVPQYGQQLQHNCGKATHARFGFFLAVEHGGLLGPLTAVIGPHKAKAPSAQVTENVPQRVDCGTARMWNLSTAKSFVLEFAEMWFDEGFRYRRTLYTFSTGYDPRKTFSASSVFCGPSSPVGASSFAIQDLLLPTSELWLSAGPIDRRDLSNRLACLCLR